MDAMTPTTAERVGHIISSQTSLSKELQFKLPRAGESISGSGNGAGLVEAEGGVEEVRSLSYGKDPDVETSSGESKAEARSSNTGNEAASVPGTVDMGSSVDAESPVPLAGTPVDVETIGTFEDSSVDGGSTGALDVTEIASATISTELQDLPEEEFSVEWKLAREEEAKKEEKEREERQRVRRTGRAVS